MRLSLLLVLLLAGAASAAEEPIEKVVLGLSDRRRCVACYRELLKRKDPRAIPLLQSALPFADTTGQYYGVLVLGTYRTKDAHAALQVLAAKHDPHLRVLAGAALYRLGDKSAVRSMADALLTPGVEPAVRYLMIVRSWAVKEPEIRAAVAALLLPKGDPVLLGAALHALHVLDARKESVAAVRLLEDERLVIRAQAAALLFRYGREAHAAVVAEGIRVPLPANEWLRVYAYLAAAGRSSPVILDAIADRAGREKDPTTVEQLLAILGRYPHLPAAKVVETRLSDGSDRVVTAAFRVLGATPGALPTAKLTALLAHEKPLVRLLAAEVLRQQDDAAGLRVATGLLAAGTPTERAEAARILGGFLEGEAVGPLIDALLDADPAVRVRALAGLTRILGLLFPYRRFQPARAGYDAAKGPAENREAVEAFRRWWADNRAKDW